MHITYKHIIEDLLKRFTYFYIVLHCVTGASGTEAVQGWVLLQGGCCCKVGAARWVLCKVGAATRWVLLGECCYKVGASTR